MDHELHSPNSAASFISEYSIFVVFVAEQLSKYLPYFFTKESATLYYHQHIPDILLNQ